MDNIISADTDAWKNAASAWEEISSRIADALSTLQDAQANNADAMGGDDSGRQIYSQYAGPAGQDESAAEDAVTATASTGAGLNGMAAAFAATEEQNRASVMTGTGPSESGDTGSEARGGTDG
jgi:kynureninase